MPTDSHLEWTEIRDFTPGYWEVGDIYMPPNAAQTMTDCFPMKQGGLRAWFKPTTFPTTGIDSVSDETPLALFAHENLINRSGNGVGNDYYLITWAAGAAVTKVYRMDQTAAGPPTTWTKIKTHATGLQPTQPLHVCNYVLTDGTRYFVYGLGAGNGADAGVWIVKYSDGTLTQLTTGQQAIVANYQSRLIIAGTVSNGNAGTIQFTDPGLLTNINTNEAPVDESEGLMDISGFATFSPGDLMVFKSGAPIYLVQGDLTNYMVRQMNGSVPGGIKPVRGPAGVIFTARGRVYSSPDGSQIQLLTEQIKTGSLGGNKLTFHDHWLWFGRNGLIMDTDTGAIFKTSQITTTSRDPVIELAPGDGFMFANSASSMQLWTVQTSDGSTTGRCESYTWKSSPIRHPTGRQIEIRAVEVYARSRNGATSTVAVTVNGVTQTRACDVSNRGALMFYFMGRGEYLDVQVVSASNASGVEAPIIEVVRIGAQGGHYLPAVNN